MLSEKSLTMLLSGIGIVFIVVAVNKKKKIILKNPNYLSNTSFRQIN